MTDARIVVTGAELLRQGHRGFEPVVQELIVGSRSELQLVAYLFTPAALDLLDLVGRAAERGVQVSIVVNRFDRMSSEVKKWFHDATRHWERFRVSDFSKEGKRELHAKLCVSDRKRAVLGSANFTWGGLVSNYEVGVELSGESAWKLAAIVDELMAISSPRA